MNPPFTVVDASKVLILSALVALTLSARRAGWLPVVALAASLASVQPADAGAICDLFRTDVPHVPRAVFIVSARKAPEVAGCCETVFGRRPAECFTADTRQLEVLHRNACGCTRRACWSELKASIDPSKPTVIFTHGSFITFDYFQRESPRTARWLECGAGRAMNVIFFAWPSDGCIPTCAAAVRVRERRARTYSFYLAELLRMLPPHEPGCPVVLASHSHGGEMVCATLHLLGGGAIGQKRLACPPPVQPRALLFAPAMDANDLDPGQSFDRALRATPAMAVIYSRKDIANRLYPLRRFLADQSLGKTGFRNSDAAVIGPLAGRVKNLDLTASIGCTHVWSAYLDRPGIARSLRSYFR